jgi:hypothetical protein
MGYIIDASTGAGRKLKPKNISVILTKKIDVDEESGEGKDIPQEDMDRVNLTDIEQELDKLEKMKDEGKITEEEYKIMRGKIIERY